MQIFPLSFIKLIGANSKFLSIACTCRWKDKIGQRLTVHRYNTTTTKLHHPSYLSAQILHPIEKLNPTRLGFKPQPDPNPTFFKISDTKYRNRSLKNHFLTTRFSKKNLTAWGRSGGTSTETNFFFVKTRSESDIRK